MIPTPSHEGPRPSPPKGEAPFPALATGPAAASSPSHEGAFSSRKPWWRAGFFDREQLQPPAFTPSDIPALEALHRLATSPSERADWAEILDKTTDYLEGYALADIMFGPRRRSLLPS